MRVVFMGTPSFAVPALHALADAHHVACVYTQPDRPSGRGRTPRPSPVKEAALERGLEVRQPVTLRDAAEHAHLRSLESDVVCVAAYGLILPPEVLEVPPYGCLNIHASLLPRYRGAAPVHRAILDGEKVSGVSIMRMEEGLDTGPYALQVPVALDDLGVEKATALLAEQGATALLHVLDGLLTSTVEWTDQDDSRATYAAKITRCDVALHPGLTVEEALRRLRASSRSAPSRACVDGTSMTIVSARRATRNPGPGQVGVDKDALVLGFADGGIVLDEVRPEGRSCMDGSCFARGARLGSGASWEPAP